MEEIINSIMQTPDNTNPNVLRSQLQGMGSSRDGGVLVVHVEEAGNVAVLDKTWKEISDAPVAVLKGGVDEGDSIQHLWFFASKATYGNGSYNVIFRGDNDFVFTASSEDDYPVMNDK